MARQWTCLNCRVHVRWGVACWDCVFMFVLGIVVEASLTTLVVWYWNAL